MTGNVPARIVLRPLGSAMPLGVSGLAVASLLTAGQQLGWTGDRTLTGAVLLVSAVPLQLIASAFAFPSRDGAGGTAMGLLAVSWLALGTTLLLSPGPATEPLGLVLAATGLLLAGAAAGQALGKPLAGAVVGLAALRFELTAVYELSGRSAVKTAAGVLGLLIAAGAAYLVWALVLEDARDQAILPTGRRGRGAEAMTAPDPLGDVAHDAGVREQL